MHLSAFRFSANWNLKLCDFSQALKRDMRWTDRHEVGPNTQSRWTSEAPQLAWHIFPLQILLLSASYTHALCERRNCLTPLVVGQRCATSSFQWGLTAHFCCRNRVSVGVGVGGRVITLFGIKHPAQLIWQVWILSAQFSVRTQLSFGLYSSSNLKCIILR